LIDNPSIVSPKSGTKIIFNQSSGEKRFEIDEKKIAEKAIPLSSKKIIDHKSSKKIVKEELENVNII
tara:strand:- start:2304 stop:2504 length:201 start_codon:yes stop_codon:yes gene_type:complete